MQKKVGMNDVEQVSCFANTDCVIFAFLLLSLSIRLIVCPFFLLALSFRVLFL